MPKKFVPICTCTKMVDAELQKSRLDAAGIECVIENEGIVGANPLLANAVGWIRVNVPESEAEKAKSLLK